MKKEEEWWHHRSMIRGDSITNNNISRCYDIINIKSNVWPRQWVGWFTHCTKFREDIGFKKSFAKALAAQQTWRLKSHIIKIKTWLVRMSPKTSANSSIKLFNAVGRYIRMVNMGLNELLWINWTSQLAGWAVVNSLHWRCFYKPSPALLLDQSDEGY